MSAFKIKRWFAPHDGRTKFYQVFLIESEESSLAYVVTHWGSYDIGAEPFPANTGQCKIKQVKKFEGEWEASRAREAKKNRGYRFELPSTEEFFDASKFRNRLTLVFKVKDALGISVQLVGSKDEDASTHVMGDATEADLDHLFGREKTPPTPPTPEQPKHSEWGTW